MYSYAPHRPTLLRKWMPDTTGDISWEWIKKALPSIREVEPIYDVANMLAKPSKCTLGKLPSPSPELKEAHSLFMRELDKLRSQLKWRNHDYDYLHPDNVACSIDI